LNFRDADGFCGPQKQTSALITDFTDPKNKDLRRYRLLPATKVNIGTDGRFCEPQKQISARRKDLAGRKSSYLSGWANLRMTKSMICQDCRVAALVVPAAPYVIDNTNSKYRLLVWN
jgi:hypothetical protein